MEQALAVSHELTSQIKINSAHGLAMYLVGQYFAKQPVLRMSYGHQWVYAGFKKSFIHLIKVYGYHRALEIWQKKMQNNDLPTHALTRQTRFRWRRLRQIAKPTTLLRAMTWQTRFEVATIQGSVRLYLSTGLW